MEAIGLALAIYPAVILAFEQFKVGAKYFNDWARFRRQYENRIRDIEAQQLTFEELLFNLMCCGRDPYLKWADDKATFLNIVSDQSYDGWKDPKLKRNLEIRLGDKCGWFLFTIKRIGELLRELSEELRNINTVETSDKTPDWWRFQWGRIKRTLFAEEYMDKYKEAKGLNDDLLKILELHDKHQALRASGGNPIAKFFKTVQENARCLHKILENSWHCHCHAAHKALFLLEQRLRDRESQFCLVFSLPQSQLTINNNGPPSIRESIEPQEVGNISKEVHIEIQETNTDNDPGITCVVTAVESLNLETISVNEISDQRVLQQTRLIGKKRMASRPRFREMGAMMASKLRRWEKSTVNAISETESQPELPISPRMQQEDSSNLIPLSRGPRVTFSQQSAGVDNIMQRPLPIPELCMTIHNCTAVSCLGYLHDERKTQYHLYLRNSPSPERGTVTLKQLLEGDRRKFPRQKRLLVAANLASSLAQLQRTRWFNNHWGKEDIIFSKSDQSVIFEKPYVATEFLSTPADISAPSDESGLAEERDLNLHIKTSLESLGIVLVELCLGEPIENSSDKVRLRPQGDQPNHEFRLAIANAWTSEELRDEGPEFESPIDNCLRFPDIRRIRHGQYQEVLGDIYLAIVKPLHDEVIRTWPSPHMVR